MKTKALHYYNQGYNCSQCVLKALEDKYKVNIPKQSYAMCSAVSNGFGVGGMCSVLIAGIMAFGVLFDEQTAKRLRIKLLSRFQETHKSNSCESLKMERRSGRKCEVLVADIAELIDEIIEEEEV